MSRPASTASSVDLPAPLTDGLAALTSWVEHGKAPRTLPAALINADGRQVEHDLCSYPAVSRYKGHGDLALASSFRCVTVPALVGDVVGEHVPDRGDDRVLDGDQGLHPAAAGEGFSLLRST